MQGEKSKKFGRIGYNMPYGLNELLVTALEVCAAGTHTQR